MLKLDSRHSHASPPKVTMANSKSSERDTVVKLCVEAAQDFQETVSELGVDTLFAVHPVLHVSGDTKPLQP